MHNTYTIPICSSRKSLVLPRRESRVENKNHAVFEKRINTH